VTIPSLVANSFLEDLALVLSVAAATTVIFRVMRQPVVVGYLAAGMIVGPYTPESSSTRAVSTASPSSA
jgi:Kef-type K+ transport system membrane component KefB